VITRDNAMVRVDGVVFFQILDAAKAGYEITDLQVRATAPERNAEDSVEGHRRASA
jgi:regulator of protease activity HflC (stomatin/prohibitin superfamily)